MKRYVKCTDCAFLIDPNEDEFCMVTPHGGRYLHKEFIPLCPDCRTEQGYDIRVSYRAMPTQTIGEVIGRLPLLTHQPETSGPPQKHIENYETISRENNMTLQEENTNCVGS